MPPVLSEAYPNESYDCIEKAEGEIARLASKITILDDFLTGLTHIG